MKFLIFVAALVAVSSADHLRDFSTVVEGAKTTLVGPSGVIHSDSGSIVKDRFLGVKSVIAPSTTVLRSPLLVPKIIDSTLLDDSVVTTARLSSPLVRSSLINDKYIIGSPLLDGRLIGAHGVYGLGGQYWY